jgi:hypothetical protein
MAADAQCLMTVADAGCLGRPTGILCNEPVAVVLRVSGIDMWDGMLRALQEHNRRRTLRIR